MKQTTFLLGLVIVGVVSCTLPVEPLQDSPVLSAAGKTSAKRLVFLLKTLRTYHDVLDAANRFDFTSMVLDTPEVSPDFWDPQGVGAPYARALAKQVETPGDPVADYRAALARSVADTFVSPSYLPAVVDSLLATPPNMFNEIRVAYPAPEIDSPWTGGYDSLFARWDTVSRSASVDSVLQYRTMLRDGITVEDVRLWKGLGVSLSYRDQRHSMVGRLLYRRLAGIGATIFDRIELATDTGTWAIEARRKDDSVGGWWSDGRTSRLVAYLDTLYRDNANFITRRLRDTIDGVARDPIYDFTDSGAQIVRIYGERVSSLGDPDVSRFDFVQRKDSTSTGFELISYQRTDEFVGTGRFSVALAAAGAADSTRLLTMMYEPGEASRRTTTFGSVRRHRYLYTLTHSVPWSNPLVVEAVRVDSMAAGEKTSVVVWRYVPVSPLPLNEVAGPQQGSVTVTAAHVAGDGTTRSRQWTVSDTGTSVGYGYLWAGVGRDTIRFSAVEVPGGLDYAYTKNKAALRLGRVLRTGETAGITDTLLPGRRVAVGEVGSGGDYGSVVVGGLDTFLLRWHDDTIRVEGAGAVTATPDSSFAWVLTDDRYVTEIVDGAGDTSRYSLRMDAAGVIEGQFDGPDSLGGRAIKVAPTYVGSARFTGMAENTDAGVWATLKIQLWGENSLGGEYFFY